MGSAPGVCADPALIEHPTVSDTATEIVSASYEDGDTAGTFSYIGIIQAGTPPLPEKTAASGVDDDPARGLFIETDPVLPETLHDFQAVSFDILQHRADADDTVLSAQNHDETSHQTEDGTSAIADFITPSDLPVAFFLAKGHQALPQNEIFSEISCERPGCRNSFRFDVHVPHKRYCGDECYESVRLARKRLLHWNRLTGCRFAREIYRLLDGKRAAPG